MKFQLSMYGIGFLILIVSNVFINNLDKDTSYNQKTFEQCLRIQKTLNGDLKKCL